MLYRDSISSMPDGDKVSMRVVPEMTGLNELLTGLPSASEPSQSPFSDISFWKADSAGLVAAMRVEVRVKTITAKRTRRIAGSRSDRLDLYEIDRPRHIS